MRHCVNGNFDCLHSFIVGFIFFKLHLPSKSGEYPVFSSNYWSTLSNICHTLSKMLESVLEGNLLNAIYTCALISCHWRLIKRCGNDCAIPWLWTAIFTFWIITNLHQQISKFNKEISGGNRMLVSNSLQIRVDGKHYSWVLAGILRENDVGNVVLQV